MTKIDIFSGFLGAGKTTLIKKLIKEAYSGEKLVLIENEFGQIGIDGGFMQDAGIEVREMNSGCICCSLVGDFGKALEKVLTEYKPDRILIEPSGVGKLSDIIRAVQNVAPHGAVLNGFTTVVDVNKCKMYMKNFGEFFNDQVENAGCIVLSHTEGVSEAKLEEAVAMLKEHNATAVIVTTPWSQLDGKQLLTAMERRDTIEDELARLAATAGEEHHHHHHHHHDDDDDECDDTRKEYHRDAVADAVFVNTFAEPHCKACAGSEAGDDDEAGEEACAGEVILDGNVITVCHNKRKCNCNNAGDFIQLLLTFRTALCHFFKCGDCDGKKLNNDGCCNIR
mgnify:CR=1 FL=1